MHLTRTISVFRDEMEAWIIEPFGIVHSLYLKLHSNLAELFRLC
jgi:hypothetical protein